MGETHTDRDRRDDALASVLASAVRSGDLLATDALRVVRHELRRKNTNKKATIWPRSTAANEVIVRYAERG